MSMTVKVNNSLNVWAQVAAINQDDAVRAMANAIDNVAQAKAPVLTGALKGDGRVRKIHRFSYEVQFGDDDRVPYARRRHFENKKNPQTKYYLQNAGDEVAKRGIGVYL